MAVGLCGAPSTLWRAAIVKVLTQTTWRPASAAFRSAELGHDPTTYRGLTTWSAKPAAKCTMPLYIYWHNYRVLQGLPLRNHPGRPGLYLLTIRAFFSQSCWTCDRYYWDCHRYRVRNAAAALHRSSSVFAFCGEGAWPSVAILRPLPGTRR